MQTYRVRIIKPEETNWMEIQANSWQEAANQDWKDRGFLGLVYWNPLPTGGKEIVRFHLVEVEGVKVTIVRMFERGIYRAGRAKTHKGTLDYIAKELGWTYPPEELLDSGWDGEEEEWK